MECRYCHEKGHTISRCNVLIKKKRNDDKRWKGSGQVMTDKDGWVQCGVVCQEVVSEVDSIKVNKSINKFDFVGWS